MSFKLIETIQVGFWTHHIMACAARCIFVIKLYLFFIKLNKFGAYEHYIIQPIRIHNILNHNNFMQE